MRSISVTLPFPPAILSGHANGNGRWKKIAETKRQRERAKAAVEAELPIDLPATGDVRLHIHFVMPDRRSDKLNCVNRMKGAVDGIADALGINDRRFLPSIGYGDPQKPGCVIVTIGGE